MLGDETLSRCKLYVRFIFNMEHWSRILDFSDFQDTYGNFLKDVSIRRFEAESLSAEHVDEWNTNEHPHGWAWCTISLKHVLQGNFDAPIGSF
jgi:hypothetical protein